MEWSLNEIESAFIDAMREAGIPPERGGLILDGKKHRYRIVGDGKSNKEGNGEYQVYIDEHPAGWFKSYRASHNYLYQTWAMRVDKPLNDDDRKRYLEDAEARAEQRRLKEEQKDKDQARCVLRARDRWNAATPADAKHPYLSKKGLRLPHGARILGQELILPLLNEHMEIASVQRISPDGGKKFEAGAPVRGCFIVLPKINTNTGGEAEPLQGVEALLELFQNEPSAGDSSRVWLCEGFATGATIAEATGERVVCALNAGNMLPVARILKKLLSGREIIAAPDWDRSRGNAGMAVAFDIQDELGLPAVPPVFGKDEQGSDWNDFCALHGLKRTGEALFAGLEKLYGEPCFQVRRREKLFPDVNANGIPKKTIPNLKALMGYLGISAKYNEVRKSIEVDTPNQKFSIDNRKNAFDGYMASKCVEYGLNEKTWETYALTVADTHAYNPVRAWILSKPWDGVTRLLEFMDTVSTPMSYPEDLKELLITKWLLSAVAAIFVKKDFHCRGVLVLQGEQSMGKTSWFKRLFPKSGLEAGWFGEAMALNPDNKDSVKLSVSKWIVELGELEATFKKADLNKLKGFLTASVDELRLPYAKGESEFPRRTVFAATVNDRKFLLDDTGNTRWWCIEADRVDYRHEIDTQQLFAEIYETLFMTDAKWWLSPEQERRLEVQNSEYRIPNPVEDLVRRRLVWSDPKSMWRQRTITEMLMECGMERVTTGDAMKASSLIRKMTGQNGTRSGRNGSMVYLMPCADKRPDPEPISLNGAFSKP